MLPQIFTSSIRMQPSHQIITGLSIRWSSNKKEGPAVDFGFKEVPWGEKQSLVGQVFSSVASKYDIMNDLMSVGMHRLWKDHLVHETLRPSSGQRHLDVAGGTGDVAFRVLRAIRQAESRSKATGEPGSVVVCDINPEMLAEGKKKAEVASDLARDKGLSFVEGDAESLPAFPDASFDSYSIAFGIRNVTDRAAALREALRVLRPGGRFLCLEFSHVTQPGIREAYNLYSLNVIPKIGGLVANDASSYQYLVESIRKFPDQETFAGMIKEAGFRAVTYENLNLGVVAIHSGFKL